MSRPVLECISELPADVVALIRDFLPGLWRVTRRSNEGRRALAHATTASAHCIHIAIQRFHWLFAQPAMLLRLNTPLYHRRGWFTREAWFISDTLSSANVQWPGPAVPYGSYWHGGYRVPAGVYPPVLESGSPLFLVA